MFDSVKTFGDGIAIVSNAFAIVSAASAVKPPSSDVAGECKSLKSNWTVAFVSNVTAATLMLLDSLLLSKTSLLNSRTRHAAKLFARSIAPAAPPSSSTTIEDEKSIKKRTSATA